MSAFPPPDATREQVRVWMNERAAEHNAAAVEMLEANRAAARTLWAKLDPATRRVIEASERKRRGVR